MSLNGTRTEIVTAINGAGLKAYSTVPTDVQVDDCWPAIDSASVERIGQVIKWNVFYVLANDIQSGEQRLDEVLPDLLEALEPVIAVKEWRSERIQFPNGTTQHLLIVSGFREE